MHRRIIFSLATLALLCIFMYANPASSQTTASAPSVSENATSSQPAQDQGLYRRIYQWVIRWAKTPYAVWALFLIAFAESSFFPIPPDPFLIACAIETPSRAFFYAGITSVASVLGGIGGYLIGYGLYKGVGSRIVRFYKLEKGFKRVGSYYSNYAGWAVGIAGFTPLPYKLFTIAAGAVRPPVHFGVFVVASAVSRSARFFLVGGLIYFFGEPVKRFIEDNFNMMSVVFVVLLVLGFVVIKRLVRRAGVSAEDAVAPKAEGRRSEAEAESNED